MNNPKKTMPRIFVNAILIADWIAMCLFLCSGVYQIICGEIIAGFVILVLVLFVSRGIARSKVYSHQVMSLIWFWLASAIAINTWMPLPEQLTAVSKYLSIIVCSLFLIISAGSVVLARCIHASKRSAEYS